MNDVMKTQITQMRTNGMSFGMMSLSLGLPASTIKSFCRRNGIEAQEPADKEGKTLCECCGKLIEQNPKRKLKRFCSDRCRNRWWSNNMDKVNRKAYYDTVCAGCGKTFKAYGNAHRKYCTHECYIKDRFGGGSSEEG